MFRGFFAAFACVALTTTVLRDGVGRAYGFLPGMSDSKSKRKSNKSGSQCVVSRHRILDSENRCRGSGMDSRLYSSMEEDQHEPALPTNLQFRSQFQSRNAFLRTLKTAGLAAAVASPPMVEGGAAFAFDGGVGGLGKTKPETGVELFDETSAPIQNEQGIVSSEIKGRDGSPILVSFQTPWPLLPTSGALEARDIRSTESAFVQVASLTPGGSSGSNGNSNWREKKAFQKVLMESVFAAQGKFGAYGQPYDVQVKKVSSSSNNEQGSTDATQPEVFSVGFTTLTPAMRESERRALVAAQQVGTGTLVLLVVTTTSARYASNEKTFKAIAASFEAIAAPETGLNKKRVSSK